MNLFKRIKNLYTLSAAEITTNTRDDVRLKLPDVGKPKGQAIIVELDKVDMFRKDDE